MGSQPEIKTIAMIGCGSMGGGMALLFAEHGLNVSIKDPAEEAMDKIVEEAKKEGFGDRIHPYKKDKDLCGSLQRPRVIAFSLPHGTVGDSVLGGLLPYLEKDDIILDAANEHYENTQRRQAKCTTRGIRYVGMGVSGGYQAARNGPSMCPGGDDQTLKMVLPLLEKVAAKDAQGRPCVAAAGLGGSGHYVKMLHNGIEHGMMSAISEAYAIMRNGLGMDLEEIGGVFEKWNKDGELKNTFLIDISARICRTIDPKTHKHVLDSVLDKVVQDLTGEEGTGVWSNIEAVRLHIAAPTLTTAHYFRLGSAYEGQRKTVNKLLDGGFPPQKLDVSDKDSFVEKLRIAVATACLASYVQGMNVIEAANQENKWSINYDAVWQIWRGGCIIQDDYISDEILKPVLTDKKRDTINFLQEERVAQDFKKGYPALKEVLAKATAGDFVVPSLSATLEYLKYQSNIDLPTSFYEAQLDYFGNHMYDEKGEDAPGPTEGKHHFEWKPARQPVAEHGPSH